MTDRMQGFWKSIRHALRRLLRVPLFSAICVLTLGLGIGANAAIFSVINGVLLKPLPFPDPDRLVGVWHTAPGLGFDLVNQSPATYFTYREQNRVFVDIGIWDNSSASITGLEAPEEVEVMRVTDGTLPLLGVDAVVGRRFSRSDDQPGSTRTVMLSHDYWVKRFGSDPGVVGRTLTIDGNPHEIIGVAPQGFHFLNFNPALFLPMRWDRATVTSGNFSYQAIARLEDGVTIEQANADVARMIPLSVETFPGPITLDMLKDAHFGPRVRPLKEDVVGDIGSVLWVLLGTVGIIFLIACANVANLFLVRAEGRYLEMAIRSALGASRLRAAIEILSESVALGLLGGLAGLALAAGGIQMLIAMAPESVPRLHQISIDPATVAFTVGISLLAGLLFGILPVFKLAGPRVLASLQDGSRGSSQGGERQRARSLLAVAQVALALILLIGAGLMIRSFQALRAVEPGFQDPEEVTIFRLFIPERAASEALQVARTHEAILNRIAELPAVSSVGLSTSVTMDGWDNNDAVFVEDFPTPKGQVPPIRRMKNLSPGYFETMQIPLLAGRTLEWGDIWDLHRVAIVTQNFAREYWGNNPSAALGKRLLRGTPEMSGDWYEIVGVVGNVYDDGLSHDPVKTVYWPMLWKDEEGVQGNRSMVYVVRSSRVGTAGFEEALRDAVWSINPDLPLANLRTLNQLVENSMARTSFTLIMLIIAAGVALVLGTVGIYGVLSYIVSQRTREIGVRMALGASHRDVSALILRRGLWLTALGVITGVLVALGLTRFMASILFGVDPLDPITFAGVAAFLALVAFLASYLPARRAARVSPIQALKT